MRCESILSILFINKVFLVFQKLNRIKEYFEGIFFLKKSLISRMTDVKNSNKIQYFFFDVNV